MVVADVRRVPSPAEVVRVSKCGQARARPAGHTSYDHDCMELRRHTPSMSLPLLSGILPAARTGGNTVQYIWNHPGVRDGRLRALSRYVGWQVWERTARRPVTTRLPAGALMRCYPHSAAASMMLYCRLPEWDSMRFVLDYLRPGDVFVDVGANVGSYTLLAGEVPGVRVVAFEPASLAFPRLSENVRLNHRMDITLHRSAVGQTDTEALLTVDLDSTNRIVPVGGESGRTEQVRMVRLDTVIGDRSDVAMIKIDVEGHEPEVLAGAEQLLRRCRPALVVEHNDADRLAAFFDKIDYVAARYLPDERELRPLHALPDGRVVAGARPGCSGNVVAVAAEDLDRGVRRRLTTARE